jgi:hypothetical protein
MGSWFSTVWDLVSGIPSLDGKVAVVTGAKQVSAVQVRGFVPSELTQSKALV